MNPFTLDVRTLAFVVTLVSTMLSLLMLYLWLTSKTYKGFGLWTAGNAVGAAGFFLLGLSGSAPEILTVVFANTFIVGCLALSLEGTKLFFGRSASPVPALVTLLPHAIFQAYFTYIVPDDSARIYITSLFAVFFSAWFVYEFTSAKQETQMFTASLGAVIFGILSGFMAIRVILTFLFSGTGITHTPDWIQALTIVMLTLLEIIWTTNFLMLNSERLQNELKNIQVELEKLATTDFLTGICNSRSFTQMSENEISRAVRFRQPLSLIMFDVDRFKMINDNYGHGAGDIVLKMVAEVAKSNLRAIDVIGRIGGEEFGVLLPHTDVHGANLVAEALRAAIESTVIQAASGVIKMSLSVTASFGVTSLQRSDYGLKQMLDRADAQLYEAKHAGRNCVRIELPAAPVTDLRLVTAV